MDHLRYSGLSFEHQSAALETFVRANPLLMQVLEGMRDAALPDGWLVSGALYNMVWNRLTDRPALQNVKDIDVIYFDDSDLSYEAEDVVIKKMAARFKQSPVPVEVRNQARVHLWFPDKFGYDVPPLGDALQSLERYASKTHAVAAQLNASGKMTIAAPFGLDDIFSFRIVPNHALDNRRAHEQKGARAKATWPQVTVEPW